MFELRWHVIPLTDVETDANGNPTHPYNITSQEFAELVKRVNNSFEGTNIQLAFDALEIIPTYVQKADRCSSEPCV